MTLQNFYEYKGALRLTQNLPAGAGLIFNPLTGEPYLPGSDLKNRLKTLLEKYAQKRGDPRLLGSLQTLFEEENRENAPARVIVRDAEIINPAIYHFHPRKPGENFSFPPVPAGALFSLDAGAREYAGDPRDLYTILGLGLKLLAESGLRDESDNMGGAWELINLTLDDKPFPFPADF